MSKWIPTGRGVGQPSAPRAALPADLDGRALQAIEVRTRAEVAKLLGITRQAVEHAEINGLKKLCAARAAFEGYL